MTTARYFCGRETKKTNNLFLLFSKFLIIFNIFLTMESKLPKPSALRKPTVTSKQILPMDRIKPASTFSVFTNKTQLCASANSINSTLPLSRDISNKLALMRNKGKGRLHSPVQRKVKKHYFFKDRAASPDVERPTISSMRSKLRRSRSACDIRDIRPLKRGDASVAPIPSKTSRIAGSNSLITFQCTSKRVPSVQTTKSGGRTTNSSNQISVGKKIAAATSVSNTSSTGTGKVASKRIPPYDFKARYKDLLEKHTALKEKLEEKNELLINLENIPELLEDTQNKLITTQEELKNAQTLIECLQRQSKLQQEKLATITHNLAKTSEENEKLTRLLNELKTNHAKLNTEAVELRERSSSLAEQNAQLSVEVRICREQLFRSNMERKELHNTVMDLRGNIRVFCRVRPNLECEADKLPCGWNYVDESTVEIVNVDATARSKNNSHMFTFDQVFHPGSDQDSIFEMVSPLIQSALDGYNICIFAYGQTGSGKTYTMDGIPSNPGVIPRTVELLFESIKNYRNLGWKYEIKVTFLEIYNEVLYDLLSNEQKDMEIRMVKNNKNDIYVSNVTQETVNCAEHLRELMKIAKMNRATAATVGNERSSRSHAVTKIELFGCHAEKQELLVGSINLVDLAGSESPKTSTRMNETKNINRSLSELTNVILALLQKQDHIPYRNSKLTHLLMPSLGGNSKTLMFINVAPLQECFVESLKSLRFAATVNQCKMAKAKRNRIPNNSFVNDSS